MDHAYVPGAHDRDYCWHQYDPNQRGRGNTCGKPKDEHQADPKE